MADIGLVGLGVMGSNLALNMAEKGYTVAVWNRTAERTDAFIANAGSLAERLVINANTVARVYATLEQAGILETKRGVGTFVAATPALAHPPRQHERRLRAFVNRVLADATRAGFTLDDLLGALHAHRTTGGD